MRVLSGSRARAPEAEEVELPLPELSRVEDLVLHAHGRELPHTGREGEIVDLVSDAVAGEGLGDVRGDDRVYPRTLQLGDAPEDPPEIEVREAEEGLERDRQGRPQVRQAGGRPQVRALGFDRGGEDGRSSSEDVDGCEGHAPLAVDEREERPPDDLPGPEPQPPPPGP